MTRVGCSFLANLRIGALNFPDAIKLHKIGLDRNIGKVGGEQLPGADQFAAMMFGFGLFVALEIGEPAIGGAVGVTHHEDPLGLVQANRHTDLFEDEVLLEIITRRGESFGAARDNDHVGALDTLLLQELSNGSVDAMVEAAEHGGVGYVGVRGGVEMEDLFHGRPYSSC